MAGSEAIAVVIRAWPADAAPNSTDQIPSGRFLTGSDELTECDVIQNVQLPPKVQSALEFFPPPFR